MTDNTSASDRYVVTSYGLMPRPQTSVPVSRSLSVAEKHAAYMRNEPARPALTAAANLISSRTARMAALFEPLTAVATTVPSNRDSESLVFGVSRVGVSGTPWGRAMAAPDSGSGLGSVSELGPVSGRSQKAPVVPGAVVVVDGVVEASIVDSVEAVEAEVLEACPVAEPETTPETVCESESVAGPYLRPASYSVFPSDYLNPDGPTNRRPYVAEAVSIFHPVLGTYWVVRAPAGVHLSVNSEWIPYVESSFGDPHPERFRFKDCEHAQRLALANVDALEVAGMTFKAVCERKAETANPGRMFRHRQTKSVLARSKR